MVPFGQTVLLWRVARGLTQEQLASAAGVPRPNLSAIERGGRDVSLKTVRALASALLVNPGALVDGQSPEPVTKLDLSRSQMDHISHAAVYGEALKDPQENRIAREMRELSRPRLEAAGIPVPKTSRSQTKRTRHEASVRHSLPSTVFYSLLERMSDHAERKAHEREAD
jgi:transcriptional regulator with XRE-family HTH domain